MSDSFPNWITKQMIQGIKGDNLDSYMMALEGWRRGLSLTWYYDLKEVTDMTIPSKLTFGNTFSLYNEKTNQMGYFYRSRGNKVENEAVSTVANKHVMKQYLTKAEVPVSKGVMFEKNLDDETILQLVKDLQYPLVVKPTIGKLGKDTVAHIHNKEVLLHAIEDVRNHYEYDDIIVEHHVTGTEYRLYVVGNQVAASVKRTPGQVTGNGRSTIEELIKEKNKERKSNPFLQQQLIHITQEMRDYLATKDQFPEGIPERMEVVQLSDQTHINAGGEFTDVTEEISEHMEQIAIDAVDAIPGLHVAGVDVMEHDGEITILEIHATASLGLHAFPMEGQSRNVAGTIMDYHFPETKGTATNRNNIYFDYHSTHDILQKKFAQELTITDAPDGELHMARYIVSGKVQKVAYRAWVRKQAIKKGLHGYTRNLDNGNVVVVVGSADKSMVTKFKKVCLEGPQRAKVKKVKELEWTSPIKLGFEIRKS